MVEGNALLVEAGELRVLVWLHTRADPDDATWDAAIGRFGKAVEEGNVPPENWRSLVITDGGAPNTRQRQSLIDVAMRGIKMPSAVVTCALSNRIKRGIATALQWMNPNFRFFEPGQTQAALEYLGVRNHWPLLLEYYEEMQRGMPPVHTLQLAKQAMAGTQPEPRATKRSV